MINLLNKLQGWTQNGYAGNHLMADAVSDTGSGRTVGGLGKIIGDAVVAFNHSNVMLPLVTSKQAVKGAITVQFVDYTKIGSSDV